MYMQPNHTYCDIFDSNCKKYAEQFDEVGCCRLFACGRTMTFGRSAAKKVCSKR